MDGQELMTAEEDLKQKLIHGKISQDLYQSLYDKVQRQHEDIEKEGFVTEENEFTEEELEKFIAQPIKPVVFGNVYEQDLKIFKTTYYKDSAFWFISSIYTRS
jgi:long-subunit acyl-CoA synthetase (AMP-forming)